MVCSDGLTTEVEDEQIHGELEARNSPQDAVDGLIGLALRGGGRDNITVVVVDVEDTDAESDRSNTSPRGGEERGTTRPREHSVSLSEAATEDQS